MNNLSSFKKLAKKRKQNEITKLLESENIKWKRSKAFQEKFWKLINNGIENELPNEEIIQKVNELIDKEIPAKPEPATEKKIDQSLIPTLEIPKKKTDIHKLTETNLLDFITKKGKIKLYEAYYFFLNYESNYSAKNIDEMIKKLKKDGKLKTNKNGWNFIPQK